MKNIPKKIYLQIGEDADVTIDNSITDFNDLLTHAITWSSERINENDIEYVLSAGNKQPESKVEHSASHDVSNRISILSKRIYKLHNIYADMCEKYGMWSSKADRCYDIILKANEELAALYGC
jgi:hypothetical protein